MLTSACRRWSVVAPALLALWTAAAGPAHAAAVTYDVVGGAGLDVGEICLTSTTCPTASPAFDLTSAGAITGTITYDSTAHQASFSFTLASSAAFGTETLAAGSTFSASNVSTTAFGSGFNQSGALSNGSATATLSGFTQTQSAPIISGFSCSGTATFVCGVTVGPSGLQWSGPGGPYQGQFTFDVTAAPVPLPAAIWLMVSALGAGALAARTRRVSI